MSGEKFELFLILGTAIKTLYWIAIYWAIYRDMKKEKDETTT
tara:strand:+ start:645 stop:770 length:126 start_codon:yes stop_codon:yes gene_type:complete